MDEQSNKQKWFQGDSSRKFPELSKTAISVADILSRHWWRRVWVIQEVALSKRATLHCGHVSLSWPPRDHLKSSIDNFRHYAERESGLEKLMKRMLDMLQIQLCEFDSVKPSLLDLIYQFHDRLSTDPRDRVFALLSLASDEEAAQNLPDYSLSIHTVMKRLVESSLSMTQKLDILSCADGPSALEYHPSWLPEFRGSGLKRSLFGFTSSILPRRFTDPSLPL